MRTALVHDWLIHMRGGEKVLEALAEMYPDAVIHTFFCRRTRLSPSLKRMKIKTTFLQYLPGIDKYYRWLLPFYPFLVRLLHPGDVDVVISTSHCVAKAVPVPKGAYHLCYCHTPMRYLWGFGEVYFSSLPRVLKPLLELLLGWLRKWDAGSNEGVDLFVANSANVAGRIRTIYGRQAAVIYPPADTGFFRPTLAPENYYLVVSAFVPYKRVDIVIDAFNELDRELRIVGSGPLEAEYRCRARSEKISFMGFLAPEELRDLYSGARALVFPTEEDFGIVPVEAQACGTPVIALGKGGALEGVRSGVFFEMQGKEELLRALREFENRSFDRNLVRKAVQQFHAQNFKTEIRKLVEGRVRQRNRNVPS